MATKIRLQRHGKKGYAFFHIVVADSRAPRDGRFIEKIGVYNPNTNPATIELNSDRSLYWLQSGAQPTETCRRILSYKGVMLKKHLQIGVAKGAITQDTADKKFNEWTSQKVGKVESKKQRLHQEGTKRKEEKLKAEAEYRKQKEAKKVATPAPAAEEPASENPSSEA